jgi:hypothetical protein
MSRAVVEREAADELGIRGAAVLHLHNLDHVQVGLLALLVDGQDGVDNSGCQALGEAGVQLGGEGGPGDREEELAVDVTGKLELVEELRQSAEFRRALGSKQPTFSASVLAISKPSVMIRGCRPSWI